MPVSTRPRSQHAPRGVGVVASSAVHAILRNPRYTGRQVWNRQRKDEVLIDVQDVALGHTTKMRWNTPVSGSTPTKSPTRRSSTTQTFERAQQVIASRRHLTGPRERFRTRHVYVLRGRLICGVCDRKMQAHWANEMAYYRCRFPSEYALANKISHPLNVFVRERDLLPELDAWLAGEFAPHRIESTIEAMATAQADPDDGQATATARQLIADCDAKMARYRAAIDAGGDLDEITGWINGQGRAPPGRGRAPRDPQQAPPPDPRRDQSHRGTLRQPGHDRPGGRPSRQGRDLQGAEPGADLPARRTHGARGSAAQHGFPWG